MDPLLTLVAHDQGAKSKGEWDRHAYVAQIQHRRVNHHLGILQERVQSVAIDGTLTLHHGEWVCGKVEQQEEENLYAGDDY